VGVSELNPLPAKAVAFGLNCAKQRKEYDRQTILLADDSENELTLMQIAFRKAGLNSPL
jgi:hypothetical protein